MCANNGHGVDVKKPRITQGYDVGLVPMRAIQRRKSPVVKSDAVKSVAFTLQVNLPCYAII